MTRREAKELMLPWAGLIGAGAGWALTHQIGSNTSFDKCQWTSPLPMLVLGLLGLGLILLGGLLSYSVWKRGEDETGPRKFLALLGMLVAALFGMAVLWQTLASLIIPQCFG